MIVPVLLVGGATFRRLLAPRNLLLAGLAGGLVGVIVVGLPAPELAIDVHHGLVMALSAILVLPLVAGLPTSDRAGGYEQLQALRPLGSVSWALGRLLGSLVSAALLALIVSAVAAQIAGHRDVPHQLTAVINGASGPQLGSWRFALPKDRPGPYDLTLDTYLPLAGSARLEVDLHRGNGSHSQTVVVLPVRRQTVVLPDLAPERGDLYVTLRARDGLVLGRSPPRLVVGSVRLAVGGQLALRREMLLQLGFAVLVVLAAACAFHFETACLAGVFILAVELPATVGGWVGLALLMVVFAILGVALVRRQVLP